MSYIYKEENVQIEIELSDILDFCDQCTEKEKQIINERIYPMKKVIINYGNLYDDIRSGYIQEIWNKFNLEELKEIAKAK